METEEQESLWCLEANIVDERSFGPGKQETRDGTKHFRGGARVHVIDWFPGMCNDVIVIGHHRKSLRLSKMVISVAHIHNLRLKVVYNPTVIAMIKEHFGYARFNPQTMKESAENMLKVISVLASSQLIENVLIDLC